MQDEAAADAVECLTYPIESPLTATFDAFTGVLTVESTILRQVGEQGFMRLRLNFSPDAAHGFVRLLKAVEKKLDIAIADRGSPLLQQ